MAELSLFIPIKKIDEEQRLVYGTVAAEVRDNSGEVFDYAASKPYFEKWSENAYATSGGKSHGNLRVMHTAKVAGVIDQPLAFDDENKIIEACAKVVDDDEWQKVVTGCYTGFSMGGRYVERVKKGSDTHYTADPVEISLVDKPCIPTATFQVIKADGLVEERHFDDAVVLKGDDSDKPYGDVKYADPGYQSDGKARYPIDTEEHIRAAWNYISRKKNADQYTAEQVEKIKSKIISAWKSHIDKDGPPSAEKSDTGEGRMYVPTNDEMLPVAKSLAKAAGKTDADWLEFMDAARDQIVAEKSASPDGLAKADAEHTDTDCKVENCAKCADMSKGDGPPKSVQDKIDAKKDGDADGDEGKDGKGSDDDGDEGKDGKDKKKDAEGDDKASKSDFPNLRQRWLTDDGKEFVKKSDAIKYLTAPKTPSVVDQLRDLNKAAAALANGEELPAAPVIVLSKADVTAMGEQLAKLQDFAGNELVKGMYEVQSLARVISSLEGLHCAVTCEAGWEGDNSTLPAELLTHLKGLGETLIAMAEEEVTELVASAAALHGTVDIEVPALDPDGDLMELSASTLGLEKSAFVGTITERLQKRAPVVKTEDTPETLAKLAAAEERADDALAKAARVEGELAEVGELVKSLQAQFETFKNLPMPKAPTTGAGSAVTKSADVAGTVAPAAGDQDPNDILSKYTPDQITNAAIRLAQQNGRTISTAR